MNAPTLRFERAVLPHLDAAYSVARWLTGDDHAAEDAVQSAALRALNYLAGLRGDEGRAWFLAIVRNVCMDWIRQRAARHGDVTLDAVLDGPDELAQLGPSTLRPEHGLEQRATRDRVNATLRSLPLLFREVLILREIEDLSYEEIATMTGVPVGTVMSRLSRARCGFRELFQQQHGTEGMNP